MERPLPISILVINPNSSEDMTLALKPLLADLLHHGLSIDYFTAPPESPPSINDRETSELSARVAFESLRSLLSASESPYSPALQPPYNALLVACYSPHPLTDLLREWTDVPVLNIFEASLLQAKALKLPYAIVTTGGYWEQVLTEGAKMFLTGSRYTIATGAILEDFVGVKSTGLTAVELHSTPKRTVDRLISRATAELVARGARAIILGCAGMSGMNEAVTEGAAAEGARVIIVDGVRAGIVLLEGMVKLHPKRFMAGQHR
ncbi:hypothetical protein K474DRAFT_1226439 [Panus rudis PR-1116 ss-1]|nr:hypothetical protein K474DRAFT_1226439 [Panus rudis PR-1116 ss-1]